MKDFSTLSPILQTIKASTKLSIVVFDLDDTLFSTANRNLVIIHNFAADHGDEFPDFAKIATKLTLADMNWSVANALASAGLPLDGPAQKAFIPYWGSTFFTDDYVSLDLPNPGAVDFVNACYDAGAMIYYLTGRHIGDRGLKNGMGQGTVLSLTNRGFPYWKGRCELNLKLDKNQKDADYKSQAIQSINSLKGNVIATFDNEPGNVVVFNNSFPKATNFWVKTTWNPQDHAPTGDLNTISDFSNWNK